MGFQCLRQMQILRPKRTGTQDDSPDGVSFVTTPAPRAWGKWLPAVNLTRDSRSVAHKGRKFNEEGQSPNLSS